MIRLNFQNPNLLTALFAVCIALFSTLSSCDKTETLGNEIIKDEWIHAAGIDSFRFDIYHYKFDSLLTAVGTIPSAYFLGKMTDPVFGKSEAEIYAQLRFVSTKDYSFLRLPIDSVVLSLRYDPAGFYGNPNLSQTVEVYPLLDALSPTQRYYSTFKANLGTTLLGKLENFIPNTTDSVRLSSNGVTTVLAPQLRIPLDTSVFMGILRGFPDTPFYSVDTFIRYFPGIGLVAKQEASMMSFLPSSQDSKITIYYKVDDTTRREFVFNMGQLAAKAPHLKTDPVGYPVESFANGATTGDSVFYIQGFTGPDARLSMPYSPGWDFKFINYAVLQFYMAVDKPEDTAFFGPLDLMTLQDLSGSSPTDLLDFAIAKSYSSNFANLRDYLAIFGGNPIRDTLDGTPLLRYNFNITAHFQKTRKEKKGLELLISPLFKTETARRVALFGNKHSRFPARLKLVYSE